MSMCGLSRSLFLHSLHLMTLDGKFAGSTLDRKQYLAFMRLVAILSDQKGSESLLIAGGGAIADSKYKSLV